MTPGNMSSASDNSTNYHCNSDLTGDWITSYSYYLNGPFLLLAVLIGLVGNILCLLTLNLPKHRLPQINQYLLALGLWDTALIVSSFFLYNLPHLLYGRIVTHGDYVLLYPFFYMLSSASYMGSIWMVMISAIDRYFALCRPLAHRFYVGGKNRTRTLLIICSIICMVYNTPKYFEIGLDECFDTDTQTHMLMVSGSGLRMNRIYWICYKIVGGLVFYSAVPFLALTYFSIRVYCEVRRLMGTPAGSTRAIEAPRTPSSNYSHASSALRPLIGNGFPENGKRVSFSHTVIEYESRNGRSQATSVLRRHSLSNDKRSPTDDTQQALNCMLVAVLLKFLFCHSLPTILDIWESCVHRTDEFSGPAVDALVDASNFLVVINSSVNIFIYAWCSRRFRHDLRRILAKICGFCDSEDADGSNYGVRTTSNYRQGQYSHAYVGRNTLSSGNGSPTLSLMIQ